MRAAILVSLFCALRAQVDPVDEGRKQVFELSDNNFETVLNKDNQSAWLISFTASTCRYCATFRPVFAKLAFDNREANVKFGEVNCHSNPHTCRLMRVHSYPTLHFFKDGRLYKFKDAQTFDNVNAFIGGGYKMTPYKKIYASPPSVFESALTALDVTFHQLRLVYQKSNGLVRALLSLFLGFTCAFGLTVVGFLAAFVLKVERKMKTH